MGRYASGIRNAQAMRKYRLKWWYLLLGFADAAVSVAGLVGLLAFAIVGSGISILGFLADDRSVGLIPLGMVCGFTVLGLGLAIALGVICPLGHCLLSYLEVTPRGVELRSWPDSRLRYAWEDVIGVQNTRSFGGRTLPLMKVKHRARGPWLSPLTFQLGGPWGLSWLSLWELFPVILLGILWRMERDVIPLYLFAGKPEEAIKSAIGR